MSTTSTTSVCRNLHSCSESLSSDLMHQRTPSKQSMSFLWQAQIENSKTEQVYVHPLVKRSSSSLSTKSLEMCTESLGCETGDNIVSDYDDFSCHAFLEKQCFSKNKPAKNRESAKKFKKTNNFPPPLTSISGNEGVQVRTHREGGRLVIKAFSFPYGGNYFQAERENGRLKLSLVEDCLTDNEIELGKNEDHDDEENSNGVEREYCENGGDDEDDFNGGYWGEDNLRDDGGKVGCKINGGDWSGGSRCNEERSRGSERLPRLPYCVAIS
ncbi:hypothetical protein OROGR_024945 [Orobanche gracilis]